MKNRRSAARTAWFWAALYVLTVTWVPIVHAHLGLGTGRAGVESGHSTECTAIHVETACTVCAYLSSGLTESGERIDISSRIRTVEPADSDHLTVRDALFLAYPARAPPLSPATI